MSAVLGRTAGTTRLRSRRAKRLSARAKLTAFYGAAFLAGGTALLALTYALVRSRLPPFTVSVPVQVATKPTTAPEDKTGPALGGSAGKTITDRAAVLHTLLQQSTIALAVMVVISALLGWFVAGRVLRPLKEITATARRLSSENLGGERIALTGPNDELRELADTFDETLDRLALSFDSQRRFIANASHELRTPLTTQRTVIEVARAAPAAPRNIRDLCDKLLTTNERAERIIDTMLVLARSEHGVARREVLRLDRIVEEAVSASAGAATAAGVSIVPTLTPTPVAGDRGLLEHLVMNLVDNAVRYNRPGGTVTIRTGRDPALRIDNTGADVPGGAVPELFEPFRRLSSRTGSQRGAGLGLSIVRSVARAHCGDATATAREGGGLSVCVHLPQPPGEVAAGRRAP